MKVFTSLEKLVKASTLPGFDTLGKIRDIAIAYRPIQLETTKVCIHVVDVTMSKLVCRYMLNLIAKMPKITKKAEGVIKLNTAEKMQLGFVNSNPRECTYIMGTNMPRLLRIKKPQVTLKPGQKHAILMKFFPNSTPGTAEILLFVNHANTDITEECIQIKIHYQ